MLPSQDYNNLCQCESLEDVKLNLQETDYDQFLAQENKVTPAALQDKATKKLVGIARAFAPYVNSIVRFLWSFPLTIIYSIYDHLMVAMQTTDKKRTMGISNPMYLIGAALH